MRCAKKNDENKKKTMDGMGWAASNPTHTHTACCLISTRVQPFHLKYITERNERNGNISL